VTPTRRPGLMGLTASPAFMPWRDATEAQPDSWYGIEPDRLAGELDLVAGLGLKLVRFELPWPLVAPDRPGGALYDRVAARDPEWPGYRWQRPEEIVDCCLRRGLVPLPIAVFTPRWAGAGQANSPPDPGLFADFVSAAAARFRGRVELWELWNEPNLRRYWNGPLADYACGPLRRGAEALRALDPAIRVVLGGLAQGHGIAEVLAHDRESFDIASLHYYPPRRLAGLRARPEWEVGAFRDALRAADLGSVPVWLTEVGGLAAPSRPTGDGGPVTGRRGQVRLATRTLDRCEVDALLWYTLRDHVVSDEAGFVKEVHWGILDAELRPRPIATVLRSAAQALRPETE